MLNMEICSTRGERRHGSFELVSTVLKSSSAEEKVLTHLKNEGGTVFQQMALGNLSTFVKKNEVEFWPHTPHTKYKSSATLIIDLNIRAKPVKLLGENIGVNWVRQCFLRYDNEHTSNERKKRHVGLHKNQTHLSPRTGKWKYGLQNGRKYLQILQSMRYL